MQHLQFIFELNESERRSSPGFKIYLGNWSVFRKQILNIPRLYIRGTAFVDEAPLEQFGFSGFARNSTWSNR
ncbi:hypothetical protein T265_01928 [Opisthorchis viverrini]|uniref:Uncharacterized protein n=1 Tax=Opisthorchis viverrini TaxID=6198 RepID=A0A075A8F0_OPIVI|nr:hypothetical protein T265_01928 [Opisthorchis viverrini]KER32000.1 hypothetical protein T265_01928 [Opisthorchis viverrini]